MLAMDRVQEALPVSLPKPVETSLASTSSPSLPVDSIQSASGNDIPWWITVLENWLGKVWVWIKENLLFMFYDPEEERKDERNTILIDLIQWCASTEYNPEEYRARWEALDPYLKNEIKKQVIRFVRHNPLRNAVTRDFDLEKYQKVLSNTDPELISWIREQLLARLENNSDLVEKIINENPMLECDGSIPMMQLMLGEFPPKTYVEKSVKTILDGHPGDAWNHSLALMVAITSSRPQFAGEE